jgi:hypothetical protein
MSEEQTRWEGKVQPVGAEELHNCSARRRREAVGFGRGLRGFADLPVNRHVRGKSSVGIDMSGGAETVRGLHFYTAPKLTVKV